MERGSEIMRFNSALKELWNRKIISVLIVFQFTLGLFHFITSVNIYYSMNYLSNNNKCLLDINTTYFMRTYNKKQYKDFNQEMKDSVNKVYEALINSKLIEGYGSYNTYMPFELKNSSKPITEELKSSLINPQTHVDKPTIETIMIDKGYYDMLKKSLSKGKGFTAADFEKKPEEKQGVILGSFFEKYFDIGDIINNKFIVYGFLKKDKFIPIQNVGNIYAKFDKRMILPNTNYTMNDSESRYYELVQGTLLKLKNKEDADAVNKLLLDKGKDLQFYIKNLGEDIHDENVAVNKNEKPIIIMEIIIGAFFILGIVVTTLASILIRKREFGIKLAFGESLKGIFYQLLIENFITFFIGFVLSLVYFRIKYADVIRNANATGIAGIFDVKLNLPILVIVFLITFSIVIIANMIILELFLKKLEPKELIGGIE